MTDLESEAEQILEEEGRERVEGRIDTLEWVLDHDDPDLTEEEQRDAEESLAAFRAVIDEDSQE